MFTKDLQTTLKAQRRYSGDIDGDWGRLTDGGVNLAMTDGPDTPLMGADFLQSSVRLGVQPAAIRAFWAVEANGAGFQSGRPKILPERHRFSKLTQGRFDKSHPLLSNPKWIKSWYPLGQDARYDVINQWGRLLSDYEMPIDAAFAAVSYGAPQIMGENAALCGYITPFAFAEAMARDEVTQLRAFEAFVTRKGILPALRKVTPSAKSWEAVAEPYNGTGFRVNEYHIKMAAAFVRFGGK